MWSKANLKAVAALLCKRLKQLDQELQINHCPTLIHEYEIMAAGILERAIQISVLLRRSGMLTQVTACKPNQRTSDVPTEEVKSLPCYCTCNNV